jgi:hypothetical protein
MEQHSSKEEIHCFTWSCFAEPPEVGHMAFSKPVMDEGDFAQLMCSIVTGDEPFSITWSLQGDIVSSEPGLTTTQIGGRTSVLMIDAVGPRHVGTYTCNARNKAGSAKSSAELKVNGNLIRKGEKEGTGLQF